MKTESLIQEHMHRSRPESSSAEPRARQGRVRVVGALVPVYRAGPAWASGFETSWRPLEGALNPPTALVIG